MAIWLRGASAPTSKQNWPVPLDAFQRDVLGVLSRRRTPSSPVAGGAVLQLHGYRLSDDLDVFNPPDIDVAATAELDMADSQGGGIRGLSDDEIRGGVPAVIVPGFQARLEIRVCLQRIGALRRVPPHQSGGRDGHSRDIRRDGG
jgi:hypothetical protein